MDARWENITNSQDRLAGDVLVEQKPSRRASESPFALRSEDKRCADVQVIELCEVVNDRCGRHASSEVLKHVLNRDSSSDEARLATANAGPRLDWQFGVRTKSLGAVDC